MKSFFPPKNVVFLGITPMIELSDVHSCMEERCMKLRILSTKALGLRQFEVPFVAGKIFCFIFFFVFCSNGLRAGRRL